MDNLRAFCLFVGYGRSGHSAVGSIIDAHPNAVVAHELNAVKRFSEGVTREALFEELFSLAQEQARAGRHSSKAEGGTYTHRIAGQIKQDRSAVAVLGDKKGAGTARQISRHGLDYLEQFKAFIGLPIKMIHVMRNPYDIVAAGIARGHSAFTDIVPVVAAIREQQPASDWLDVYHEDLIAEPNAQVTRIVEFLGLPVLSEHLQHCAGYLYASPHERRFEVSWPAGMRERVERVIAHHSFLSRYRWEH